MSLRASGNALEATVPQDEADPLGSTSSVVRTLRKRGLPVEDNLKLREFWPNQPFDSTPILTTAPIARQPLSRFI